MLAKPPIRTRRLLPFDEWDRLREPVKKCFGEDKEPPEPAFTLLCAVEEEGDDIVGFLFLQLVPHLEPFGSLDHASFSALRQLIEQTLTSIPNFTYHLHSSSENGPIYAKNGIQPSGIMYSKTVGVN